MIAKWIQVLLVVSLALATVALGTACYITARLLIAIYMLTRIYL